MMKKVISLALVALLCLGVLTACSIGGSSSADIKHGFGTSISMSKSKAPAWNADDPEVMDYGQVQVDTAMVSVVLDKDNKIISVFFDTAQQLVEFNAVDIVPSVDDEGEKVDGKFITNVTRDQFTKVEKEEAYGMKDDSPISKEYFEQIEALQNWAKGKTIDEVLNSVDEDGVPKDLTTSCTITITSYLTALEKIKADLNV